MFTEIKQSIWYTQVNRSTKTTTCELKFFGYFLFSLVFLISYIPGLIIMAIIWMHPRNWYVTVLNEKEREGSKKEIQKPQILDCWYIHSVPISGGRRRFGGLQSNPANSISISHHPYNQSFELVQFPKHLHNKYDKRSFRKLRSTPQVVENSTWHPQHEQLRYSVGRSHININDLRTLFI